MSSAKSKRIQELQKLAQSYAAWGKEHPAEKARISRIMRILFPKMRNGNEKTLFQPNGQGHYPVLDFCDDDIEEVRPYIKKEGGETVGWPRSDESTTTMMEGVQLFYELMAMKKKKHFTNTWSAFEEQCQDLTNKCPKCPNGGNLRTHPGVLGFYCRNCGRKYDPEDDDDEEIEGYVLVQRGRCPGRIEGPDNINLAPVAPVDRPVVQPPVAPVDRPVVQPPVAPADRTVVQPPVDPPGLTALLDLRDEKEEELANLEGEQEEMEGQLEGLNEAIEEAEGLLQGDEEDELTENARRRLGAETEEGLYAQRENLQHEFDTKNRRWTREIKRLQDELEVLEERIKNYPTGTEEARRQQEAQEEARRQQEAQEEARRQQQEEARRQQEAQEEARRQQASTRSPRRSQASTRSPRRSQASTRSPRRSQASSRRSQASAT